MENTSDVQQTEINAARAAQNTTRRATSPALEEVMYSIFPVLDHGFIRLIDYMGDESAICQAARVSYGAGTKSVNEDRGLLRYLIKHRHTTPLEMAVIKVHVKLPIFVARQWIRHRMSSVNETSARYSILDNEFYIPTIEDLAPQSSVNKQGRAGELTKKQAQAVQQLLLGDATHNYRHYLSLLGENKRTQAEFDDDAAQGMGSDSDDGFASLPNFPGIARELARMNLTLNTYTSWYWKTDVHNLINFLSLRCDHHAQKEIRVYADVLSDFLRLWMPNVHQAYQDYRLYSYNLSGPMISSLKAYLKSRRQTPTDILHYFPTGTNFSKREQDEFIGLLFGDD